MKNETERSIAGALRIATVVVVILLQLAFIFILVSTMLNYAIIAYVVIEVISVINIFVLVSWDRSPSYTVTWVLLISMLPVFGYILYVLWGRSGADKKRHGEIRESILRGNEYLTFDAETGSALEAQHPERKRISRYLDSYHFPAYRNTSCEYFRLGELQFEAMIRDMENAKKFIFLEYFIIDKGKLWDRIREVLIRKAGEGVEVRLMFDDMGSIITIPDKTVAFLTGHGVQTVRFSPIHRFISRLYINYRNHQKITVIDGNIGYTGGTNIADEYVNLYAKHGHWKDTAIRMEGDGVWGLTATFLQMWDGETGEFTDYNRYRPTVSAEAQGFFQPFSDGPVNNPENPAEAMYINVISSASKYVYITTPYLVIDNVMTEALRTAALSGVDVRIIAPKIWDHWYVHEVTRSNYGALLKAGVRIYEYTPGYIHAKTIISDDDHAVTGSINMDYRSFNLHFENGVWICGAPVLQDIKRDILATCEVCEEMDYETWRRRPWYKKLIQSILRIFAILL